MIAALGLSTFKYETAAISIFITSWGHLQNILAIFDTVARTEDSVIMTVSQNKVYGIRDQRPKKGWDKGSQALGSEVTSLGIGINSASRGSVIQYSDRKC